MSVDAPPTPVCHALVPCDMAIHDSETGKYTLVGVFGSVLGRQYPAVNPKVSVYFRLSGAHGRYLIKLQLKDPASGRYLLPDTPGLPMEVPEPGILVEQSLTVVNLAFPAAGRYELVLLANGEEVGQQAMWVFQAGA